MFYSFSFFIGHKFKTERNKRSNLKIVCFNLTTEQWDDQNRTGTHWGIPRRRSAAGPSRPAALTRSRSGAVWCRTSCLRGFKPPSLSPRAGGRVSELGSGGSLSLLPPPSVVVFHSVPQSKALKLRENCPLSGFLTGAGTERPESSVWGLRIDAGPLMVLMVLMVPDGLGRSWWSWWFLVVSDGPGGPGGPDGSWWFLTALMVPDDRTWICRDLKWGEKEEAG